MAALPTLEAAYREDDVAALAREVEAGLRSTGVGGRWEIGPVDETVCLFAFGAAGDAERLRRNRALVAQAPEVPGSRSASRRSARGARRWKKRDANGMRAGEERRERARERAEQEDLERELEDEARRVRVIDIDLLKKPELKPNLDDAPEPKTIVRRGLDDARVTKSEGIEAPPSTTPRSNDPPA